MASKASSSHGLHWLLYSCNQHIVKRILIYSPCQGESALKAVSWAQSFSSSQSTIFPILWKILSFYLLMITPTVISSFRQAGSSWKIQHSHSVSRKGELSHLLPSWSSGRSSVTQTLGLHHQPWPFDVGQTIYPSLPSKPASEHPSMCKICVRLT